MRILWLSPWTPRRKRRPLWCIPTARIGSTGSKLVWFFWKPTDSRTPSQATNNTLSPRRSIAQWSRRQAAQSDAGSHGSHHQVPGFDSLGISLWSPIGRLPALGHARARGGILSLLSKAEGTLEKMSKSHALEVARIAARTNEVLISRGDSPDLKSRKRERLGPNTRRITRRCCHRQRPRKHHGARRKNRDTNQKRFRVCLAGREPLETQSTSRKEGC